MGSILGPPTVGNCHILSAPGCRGAEFVACGFLELLVLHSPQTGIKPERKPFEMGLPFWLGGFKVKYLLNLEAFVVLTLIVLK